MQRKNVDEPNTMDDTNEMNLLDNEQEIDDDVQMRQSYLEETSAEFSHPIQEDENINEVQQVYGWVGLALSIISFFFIPLLFSISGIIVGVIARNRRSVILGYSAIIIGIISLLVQLFV